MKTKSKKNNVTTAPTPTRTIYEAYWGADMAFFGYVVVEGDGPTQAILCVTSDAGAEEGGVLSIERGAMLQQARAAARNPDDISELDEVFDYRRFGRPDSTERMPEEAFAWHLAEVGAGPMKSKPPVFWYCPLRMLEMQSRRACLLAAAGQLAPVGELFPDGSAVAFPWCDAAHRARAELR